MSYELNWDGQSSILKVDLEYSTVDTNATIFRFGDPHFGGKSDIFNVLDNIKSSESEEINIDGSQNLITVKDKRAGKHKISYEINGTVAANNGNAAITKELFRPVIKKGSLYLLSGFFMFSLKNLQVTNASLKFSSISAGMKSFYSWDPDADATKTSIIPIDDLKTVFIAIENDLQIQKYFSKKTI